MSAQTRKHKIHGIEVEQVSYQGKWYTGVASRVQIAEQADPDTIRQDGHGYHVTRAEIIQLGDKWAYHCMVEYPVGSGVIRPGTDFIDLSDKAGIAKAETSAIGRALGLHGIAIEEGIASAEEMRRSGVAPDDAPAQQQPQQSTFATRPHVIHAPADEPATRIVASAWQQEQLATALKDAGHDTQAKVARFLMAVIKRPINVAALANCDSDITIAEIAKVQQELTAVGGKR